MKKTLILMVVITIFSKLFGFLREILLSYYYGANQITDAYFISIAITTTAIGFIGTAISCSFIPIYLKFESKNDQLAIKLTSGVVNFLLLCCLFVVPLVFYFSDILVDIFAPGFINKDLAITYTRIMAFGIPFSCVLFILPEYVRVKGDYISQQFSGYILNISSIAFIIISFYYGSLWIAIGTVITLFLRVIYTIFCCYRKRYKHIFDVKFALPEIRNILLQLPFMIIAVSVVQINYLIDKVLVSSTVGVVSYFNYVNNINLLISGFLTVTIVYVFYPIIARALINNDKDNALNYLYKALTAVIVIIVPFVFVFLFFPKEIIKIIYGRGAFNDDSILITSEILACYSISILALGIRDILNKILFSIGDVNVVAKNGLVGIILNIILSYIGYQYYGVSGIAISTSISSVIMVIIMFNSIKHVFNNIHYYKVIFVFIRVSIASFIMVSILYSTINYTGLISNTSFVAFLFISFVLYLCIIFCSEVERRDKMNIFNRVKMFIKI